jgi:hypothetical protein
MTTIYKKGDLYPDSKDNESDDENVETRAVYTLIKDGKILFTGFYKYGEYSNPCFIIHLTKDQGREAETSLGIWVSPQDTITKLTFFMNYGTEEIDSVIITRT